VRGVSDRAAWRHRCEDGLAGLVQLFTRIAPRALVLATGRLLGRLVGELDRRHLRIAVENMRRAFPDWDEARLWRTARGVYAHLGMLLLDLVWMAGRTRAEIAAIVTLEGHEHVEAARAAGRGVLFATAHIGSWELCGVAHGWLSGPMGVVARPLDNPLLDRRITAIREMSGNQVIGKRRALGRLLERLRRGEDVALLLDQNVQEQDGIFVQFFGRPAATTTSAALLHLKTGSPIVGGWVEVLPGGRYVLRYEPLPPPEPGGSRAEQVERLTQAINHMIEGWVRRAPQQWLWIHKRWHTRPPGERAPDA
jgi:KDO2-lipid IV(A) lauroyltransferase